MATRTEVVQLESRMETEDYRKLQGLFMVGSRGSSGAKSGVGGGRSRGGAGGGVEEGRGEESRRG